MPALAGFPERLEAARHAMACQRHRVSTATGLPSQRYATLMHGGGRKHFAKLAALLAVRIEWLTTGAFPLSGIAITRRRSALLRPAIMRRLA